MKTLWLASWYPNRLSPFNGDFIKRHAAAVSIHAGVQVIYVVRDQKGELTKDVLIENTTEGSLEQTIIYYYSPRKSIRFLDKLYSQSKYRRLFKEAVTAYIKMKGTPQLVHVQVGMKAGAVALWLKQKKNIPYVVTEHWTGFLEESGEKFSTLPVYFRALWKKIMQQSNGCSVVSNCLANSINKNFPGINTVVIPNVADTSIFFPDQQRQRHPRFIHISGLDERKNPVEMLKAFAIVLRTYPDARFDIFGSDKKEITEIAAQYGLKDQVSFHPEVDQSILARHINMSDALLLYSSYETFGCVLIEANACGVPVIVSDIPVFHETVKEGENGFFAGLHAPEILAAKMLEVIEKRDSLDRKAIVETTRAKYAYDPIARQFINWYKEVIASIKS
jgi:glycosyltransferase involved in cell wall biosynthesis